MVGSAVHRRLTDLGFTNIVVRTRAELDLTRQQDVEAFFDSERPCYVIVCAARCGGLHASMAAPAEYLTENLNITVNVLSAAHRCGSVRKLLFLAGATIYPEDAPQPIPESALLSGPPAPGSEWYGIARIVGIKMCQAYRAGHGMDAIAAVPNNIYGPREPFSTELTHVVPALIRRFHHAKVTGTPETVVWGSGTVLREFTHVDDLVDAMLLLMDKYSDAEHVNVGSGVEVTLRELAETVKEVVGYHGRVVWDVGRPDGVPRRLLDSSKMRQLGWDPKVALQHGIMKLYQFYLAHKSMT
ncbi:hypothetical protein QYE76_071834 [Lolium multiflorum]|uniref:GDP-L-fucose synthase n=1 Tax=Lolium multiflorum TaxID=4521 RepID=A0AAD8SLM4_LOLMU|nr:hypothetical protein QYE76_071831 [Lolium multiflorum]KAK1654029.1 hypothetical protein QYE76_071834 [Lolium multiflorum]